MTAGEGERTIGKMFAMYAQDRIAVQVQIRLTI
jgi:hypothetical protein